MTEAQENKLADKIAKQMRGLSYYDAYHILIHVDTKLKQAAKI